VLHGLRNSVTDNRGQASGSQRVLERGGSELRTRARKVPSSIIGAFDAQGPKQYCRLTAWTGRETDKFETIHPLLRSIDYHLAAHVADRYRAQMEQVRATAPEWVIPGTAFTTITVNNSYATGVHKDKGDLDAGFSTLACLRRGTYTGGRLVFPEYRVAVDMQDGDLLLMDAHAWHGNTRLYCTCGNDLNGMCGVCGAERISLVAYYRTKMTDCGSAADEAERAKVYAENRNKARTGE
jgi:hypothetical protein